jgi:hypothetical protein
LIDRGAARLRQQVSYKPSARQRLRDFVRKYPTGFYLLGIEILTFLITVFLLQGLEAATLVAGFFLILMPAAQAAVDFMNNLTSSILPPRPLPKLDFSEGIPDDCTTMVAVPTLLLNESQVRGLVADLEIRFLANRDRNLTFALLTDWPDASAERTENDFLADLCTGLIEDLNTRYGQSGRTPFYLFHRHRIFNPAEGSWMGWERKRGKLLDLNQVLRGGNDSFPVKVGDPQI